MISFRLSAFVVVFFATLERTPATITIPAFFLGWLLLWLPIAIPLGIVLNWNPFRGGTSATQKLPLVASLYLLAPAILWGVANLEDHPFSSYGLSWTEHHLLRSITEGWGLGVLGLAIMFLMQWCLGWITVQFPSKIGSSSVNGNCESGDQSSDESEVSDIRSITASSSLKSLLRSIGFTAVLMLVLGLWISITEELVFRGFLLNEISTNPAVHELSKHELHSSSGSGSLWGAAAISSLIFAVLHLVWEGRENIPQLPGLWLMGMVLCLARWVDGGSLGLACGLHAGWIWTIACLDTAQIFHYPGKVPHWVTGGGKPLAGITGILFLLLTGLGLFLGWNRL
jgi:membrane protease YdiL (CAAX protease family)